MIFWAVHMNLYALAWYRYPSERSQVQTSTYFLFEQETLTKVGNKKLCDTKFNAYQPLWVLNEAYVPSKQ